MRKFSLAMACLFGVWAAAAQETIRATDFGIKADSYENASAPLQRMLAYARSKPGATIVFPTGRIDLWPDGAPKRELYVSNGTESDTLSKVKTIGFLLEGYRQLHIKGENTLFVLHGKMVSFALIDCRDITLEGIGFDYERPSMSEMMVQSVNGNLLNLVVNPQSTYSIVNGQLTFFGEGWKMNQTHTISIDTATSITRYSNFKPIAQAVATEKQPFRIELKGDFSKTGWKAGDVLTVRDPYRDNVGGLIWRSVNTQLKHVNMYYMHGLGIVSQFSENIHLQHVRVAPRQGTGRVISSFADCFHFSGCKGQILIDSCYTSGSHDDPINVHGTHLKLLKRLGEKTVQVGFMHHQTYGIEAFFAGDSVAFVKPSTLLAEGLGVVASAKLVGKKIMELEMKDPLPAYLDESFVLENLTWTPSLTVTNSHFERTNARGILVTTRRKVRIENNRFYRTGMHAILIADDAASWYESGPVQDVLIRNNTFEACGYNSAPGNYTIAIAPENHDLVPNKYVHRNIRIEHNRFIQYDAPVVTARSVDGLTFSNNTITETGLLPSTKDKPSLLLTACSRVIIDANTFTTAWQPFIRLQSMPKNAIKAKGIKIE